jgi:hypothetical protein
MRTVEKLLPDKNAKTLQNVCQYAILMALNEIAIENGDRRYPALEIDGRRIATKLYDKWTCATLSLDDGDNSLLLRAHKRRLSLTVDEADDFSIIQSLPRGSVMVDAQWYLHQPLTAHQRNAGHVSVFTHTSHGNQPTIKIADLETMRQTTLSKGIGSIDRLGRDLLNLIS